MCLLWGTLNSSIRIKVEWNVASLSPIITRDNSESKCKDNRIAELES